MTDDLDKWSPQHLLNFLYIVKDTFEAQRQKKRVQNMQSVSGWDWGYDQSKESLASVRESTLTPLAMSSGDEYSSGLWLYPARKSHNQKQY